jgi:hypothetical protein
MESLHKGENADENAGSMVYLGGPDVAHEPQFGWGWCKHRLL